MFCLKKLPLSLLDLAYNKNMALTLSCLSTSSWLLLIFRLGQTGLRFRSVGISQLGFPLSRNYRRTIGLLFLKNDKFVTSGKIRQNSQGTFRGTLYMRLEKLVKQELVEKKSKKGDFAGDDRTEYKLTQKGKDVRMNYLTTISTF